MPANEQLLTLEEIAVKLRVHVNTVRNLVRRKELPAMKFGSSWRVSPRTLEKYIKSNTKEAHRSWAETEARSLPKRKVTNAAPVTVTTTTPQDVVYPVNSPRHIEEDLFND
jgi:excisionase family DNA binding protein